MDRLKGKVAFITGAATGIGRTSAFVFCREGAKVVIADVNDLKGSESVEKIKEQSGDAVYIRTDVTDPVNVQESIKKAVHKFGKLDILYNNAGGSVPEDGPITDTSVEVWQKTQSVDLFGTFLCCKYGIPELIKNGGGSVILTGSMVGLRGWQRSAYTAAKGGIISLTRLLAVDYARYKVRANCICPGLIITERTEKQFRAHPEAFENMRPLHVLGFGEPSDVAYAALYFACDESKYVTGAILSVDSGYAAVGRVERSNTEQ